MPDSENKGGQALESADNSSPTEHSSNWGPRRRPAWLRYSMAVAMTGGALVLYLLSSSAFENQPAPIIFLIPAILSAYLGGLGPGLVSTFLGVLCADFFLVPPYHSFRIVHAVDYVRLGSVLFIGVLVSFICDSLQRANGGQQSAHKASRWLALERKVRVTFAFGGACLILVGVISYRAVGSLRVDAGWVDHTHQVLAALNELLSTITDAETGVRGYVITGSEVYLEPFESAMEKIGTRQNELRAMTQDNPMQQGSLDELEPLIAERISIFRRVIELRRTQGFAGAQAAISTGAGKDVHDRIRAHIAKMAGVETGLLKERDARARHSSLVAKAVIFSGSLVALLVVMSALFLIGDDFTGNGRVEAGLREAQALLEERVAKRTKELTRANEQLYLNEEQLRLMVSGVKDYAIFMVDPEGRIANWNIGGQRLKGWSAEEIIGQHFSRFYTEQDRENKKPERELQEAATAGRYEEEGVRVRKDGSIFWAHVVITAVYDESGKLRGFAKVTQDITQRKVMEQELRTLAAVAQNSKDFIGICTPEMRGVFVNEAGLRMVGLDSLEEALDKPVLDYFWPEDREMIETKAVPILLHEGSWCGEVRFRNFKTGEPIHTVWDVFAIMDEKGQKTGYATISPNLERMKQLQTSLSEADKQLRESQARYAGIVASAMDAIITINEEQQVLVFNTAAEKMFQCPAELAIGRPISQFIPERFREKHGGHVRSFGSNGATSRAMGSIDALWALRGNGEEFPIEASISQMKTNGNKFFTVIIRDITERIKATEALRRSDARRMTALESAELGDWQIDLQTGQASRSLLHDHIFGYTERLPEWNFEIFLNHVHPEDRERVRKIYREHLEQAKKWDFECRILWPDRTIHWIWACGGPYKDKAGNTTHAMGTVADITARKNAEALQSRSQRLESLGTLSGGIAHDFNNMLLAINGNAKLAILDLPPEHPAQESLKEIAKAGTRAADLVRRILTFSRPGEVKRQMIELQPVVEEALKLVRATLPTTIEFHIGYAPNLPAVLGDSTQIHQIIVNLATNAAHAIGARSDGVIEICLDMVKLTAENSSPSLHLPEGPYVRLLVSDNGCGMDRATLERIYDPFFTTKAPGEGTGLGLSVVHGIMKNHDGGIALYSEPGKGAAFRLFFPAAGGTSATVEEAPSQIVRKRSEKIMYVDDEEGLVVLVTHTLTRLGYEVIGQTDPLRALEIFRENPSSYDAVITDLAMPQLSGFDLAKQLLAIRADIPIVMTSGYVRPEDQERALHMGLRDLILKPDTIDQMGATLDRIFQHEAG